MGGAQPLAVTMNGGVCLVVDVDPARLQPPGRRPLPRRGGRRPRRRRRAVPGRQARERPAAVGRAWSATPPTCCPSCCAAGVEIDIVTDQTSAHDPLAYLPDGVDARRLARLRSGQARGVHRPGPGLDGQARRGDGRLPGRRRRGVRLRQLHPRRGPAGRLRPGVRLPRLRARPTSGRCSARARARSAGRRCPATRPTSPPPTRPCSTCSRTTTSLHRWIRAGRERVAFQGLPARICWLGYGERDRAGLRFNEMVASGEVTRADRDRPRPPRLRLGRLAVPGDRGDGRRLRRDRRLAAAQRAGQHRVAARPGCRSTTAAASASAARSTPGR